MPNCFISREKNQFAVGVIGGPTVVIDYGGVRFLADPCFDPPGQAGPYAKLEGPAIDPDELGTADVVLLSHDEHGDNLDRRGREYAMSTGCVVTTPGGAARLGAPAIGLATWETTRLTRPDGATIAIEALPAVHGPLDGARDHSGHVNCEVTGFLLTSEGLPTVYVSGDNASIAPVAEIAARHEVIDVAVLFAGAARVDIREQGRALTLTADRAADAAILLGAPKVVPAHIRGWSLYSDSPSDLARAFSDAGVAERLLIAEPGEWSIPPGD